MNRIPIVIKKIHQGNSLAVQWLGLPAFTDQGLGSVLGRGTKIPQAVRPGAPPPPPPQPDPAAKKKIHQTIDYWERIES